MAPEARGALIGCAAGSHAMSSTTNYWDYLRLPALLDLQGGLEGDEEQLLPDELHFIVVHQVFELWFKLVLRELRLARDHMAAPEVPEEHVPHVVHHLRRVTKIVSLCADQFAVMETLTPQDFLAFRDKLIPASGFQSFQMREMEIVLGLDGAQRAESGFGDPLEAIRALGKGSPAGQQAIEHLERATAELPLRDALHTWLHRTPIHGSSPGDPGDEGVIAGFVADYLAAALARAHSTRDRLVASGVLGASAAEAKFGAALESSRAFLSAEDRDGDPRTRRIRAAILFIESYRELPLLAWPRMLLDTIVEVEAALVLFRTRHARMVERVIGRRIGTGGSAGVDYLDRTTRYRIFTELWAVRTVLLPRADTPPLVGAHQYGFAR